MVSALSLLTIVAIVLGYALRIQSASYTPMPFNDMWDALGTVRAASEGELSVADLVAQHNEHRPLLTRLQFLVDYLVFDGELLFLSAMIVVSSILLAAVLTWPFAALSSDRTTTLGFFAFALAVTLSPAGWENLTWPFQVQFVQVYLFAVAAITLTALKVAPLLRPTPGRAPALWLAATVLLGVAATYSMANGLVVWPVVLVMLTLRRAPGHVLGVVAVAGASCAVAYLWGYEQVAGDGTYRDALGDPLGILQYVVTFLGHPAQPLGIGAVRVLGGLGFAASVLLVAIAVRHRDRASYAPTLWGAAVSSFVLVTAALTALGRLGFGAEQALTSRYSVALGVFWTGLVMGLWPPAAQRIGVSVRSGGRRVDATGMAFVTVLLVFALCAGLAESPSQALQNHLRSRSEPALVSYAARVQDDDALRATHPIPEPSRLILPLLDWLRAERLGPWHAGPGDELDDAQRPVRGASRLPACRGSVDSTTRLPDGLRLNGWIAAPAATKPWRGLGVVDARGRPDGLGLTGFFRPDVKASGGSSSERSGFVAYARSARRPAGYLVLFGSQAGAPLCALPVRA